MMILIVLSVGQELNKLHTLLDYKKNGEGGRALLTYFR
jgi:hypothetical protein